MLRAKVLFENQINELALIELMKKYQKEFEAIKNELRKKYTVKLSDLDSFLETIYKMNYLSKIEIHYEEGEPKYVIKDNIIFQIEK